MTNASEALRRHAVLLFSLAMCIGLSSPVIGLDDDSIDSARDALEKQGSFPWYDRSNDGITRVPLSDSDGSRSNDRNSTWVQSDEDDSGNQVNSPTGGRNSGLGQNSAGGSLFLSVLLWGVIAILLIAVLFLIVWAFTRQAGRTGNDDQPEWLRDSRTDEQRIESLPFEVAAKRNDLLAAAEASRNRGELNQAIVYLYSYMLVKLDRGQRIHLTRGKTNRQYLGELKDFDRLQQIVERTMVAFESVFFGDHSVNKGEFDHCWKNIDAFHELVESPS